MKKGPLHFLGRKNPSLFDTTVKMREMDNVELVLQPSAIPESGTASVRARPTVKHFSSSSLDSFQGFAVPTPKVPLLPPVNGARINGSDNLSNGFVFPAPDYEDEPFVPPPPSMAPPPPPGSFISPQTEFMYGLDHPELRRLQPPPMPAPTLPSAFPSVEEEEDFSFIHPPQMAPPRPPSICSSGSSTLSASSLPSDFVPEHPQYAAPPPPPSERPPKVKMPPPKPVRLSSMSTYDSPPPTPAPPPPVQKPTPSSFNPQNTAKLYDIPKTSILSRVEDRGPKPKQLLLLEDSRSAQSTPVLVQVDGKAPKSAPPVKPVSKEGKKQILNLLNQGSPSAAPEPKKEIQPGTVGPDKPVQTQPLQKVTNSLLSPSRDPPTGPPRQTGKFSPLLDRKLRNLKGGESGASREASSPLSLLMAAKEREKHRTGLANGFPGKPRSGSSFLTSKSLREETPKFSAAVVENAQTPSIWQTAGPPVVEGRSQPPSLNGMAEPSPAASLVPEASSGDSEEEFSMPLLPPPPEFGDSDGLMEPPPDLPPPDPPGKTPPLARPLLKPKPQQAPKPPPLQTTARPTAPAETKPPPLPSPLSPSQATLLSILQRKMLEMDRKMAPAKDAEPSLDDWNSPLSDEDNVFPKAASLSKSNPGGGQAGLDLQELEDKVSTSANHNGSSSKHQHGCTFTVRPGSKQPITVVNKGAS